MTGDHVVSITPETFQDVTVRIVQTDKDRLMPIADLAEASGLERSAIRKLLERNREIFDKYTCKVIMSDQGQSRENTCLTRDGVNGLLMKSNYQRIKDPERRQRVIAFQAWAIDTLGKVMNGQLRIPNEDLMGIFNCHMQMARVMADTMGINIGIAGSVAIAHTEYLTGEDLSWAKGLIPGNKSLHIGHLTPSQIGGKIGKTAQEINRILENLGYQVRAGRDWKLTISGMMYGENIPFSVNHETGMHTGYRIKWDPDIIEKIQNYRPGLLDGQKGLLTGYLS